MSEAAIIQNWSMSHTSAAMPCTDIDSFEHNKEKDLCLRRVYSASTLSGSADLGTSLSKKITESFLGTVHYERYILYRLQQSNSSWGSSTVVDKWYKFPIIDSEGISLELNQPLDVAVSYHAEDREYIIEMPQFSIFISASTVSEAIEEFKSDFIWLWKEYSKIDDNDLTLDAIDLKRALLALVKEVKA